MSVSRLPPASFQTGTAPQLPRAAFYTGTFDPPTRAHIRIITNALRKKGFDRVVVVVNQGGSPKVFRCTAEQRVAMVKAALPRDVRDRVHVIVEPGHGKNALFDQLTRQHRYEWYGIIGYDSYRDLKPIVRSSRCWLVVERDGLSAAGAANVESMSIGKLGSGISSGQVRDRYRDGKSARELLCASTAKLIAQHGYYVTPDAATWETRAAHFSSAWNLIAGARAAMPTFVPQQSPEEHENYIRRYLAGSLKKT